METLYPGLYLQEVPGEQPIEGASTSTAAFVGVAQKGPIGTSTLVTSWNQFVATYGSYMNDSYLAYAVRGFFENGGTRAHISRAVAYTAGTKQSEPATAQLGENFAIVDAISDGVHGDKLSVEITKVEAEDKTVSLLILVGKEAVESYKDVAFEDLEDVINSESKLVKFTSVSVETAPTTGTTKLTGGKDGITGIGASDYLGDPALGTGLHAFDNEAVSLVAIPGVTDVAVITGLTSYVETRKDSFAVVEAPFGKLPATALAFKQTEASIASARVAIYYSWIQVADPIGVGKNPTKMIPPSGHILGIYARTDNERGVFKAPAGLEANVRGAIGVEYNVSDGEQAILNPEGVNAIRAFAGEGIVLWGARTTSSTPDFRYVSVRRALDFIEQSILSGSRWSVFEPNDETLWSKLTSSAESFLTGFWSQGGLKGETEAEAFSVQCDATTTTASDINEGKVFSHIGVSLQSPAEFVIFKVSMRD